MVEPVKMSSWSAEYSGHGKNLNFKPSTVKAKTWTFEAKFFKHTARAEMKIIVQYVWQPDMYV